MACFTSNILQQKQILSLNLCKYPSPSLNACKFHFLSQIPGSSPLKHTPLLVYTTPVGNILHAKLSATDHDSPTKTINSRTRKENNVLGFPSSRKIAKRDGTKHIKNRTTSLVDEKTEKRFTKDRNTIKNMDFRERKGMGSEDCTKDGNKGIKVLATMDSQGVSGEMESRAKNGSDIQVTKMEKIGKGYKQDKVDSSDIRLRVRLDMCSKRGDVIGLRSISSSSSLRFLVGRESTINLQTETAAKHKRKHKINFHNKHQFPVLFFSGLFIFDLSRVGLLYSAGGREESDERGRSWGCWLWCLTGGKQR